jgi:hypothetical protein
MKSPNARSESLAARHDLLIGDMQQIEAPAKRHKSSGLLASLMAMLFTVCL